MRHRLNRWRVNRYFSRGLAAGTEQSMRRHLAVCAGCARHYESSVAAEEALPDGEARAEARLWRSIQRDAPRGAPVAERRSSRQPILAATAVLAAASIALFVHQRAGERPDAAAPSTVTVERGSSSLPGGMVARGGDTSAGGEIPALAPALHVFRRVGDGRVDPVTDRVGSDDGLLFAYSNPGTTAGFLMVFAVDESYRVFWYYPAPSAPGATEPRAVAIAKGRSGVELGEEIHQRLPPGLVRLYGLFLPRAESVAGIERLIAEHLAGRHVSLRDAPALPVEGADQRSVLLSVTR